MVNSAAVQFLDLGWFDSPDAKRYRKKIERIKKKLNDKKEEGNYMERKEEKLQKLINNLEETIEFENQINNEMLLDNYKEYERTLKESENKEKKESVEKTPENDQEQLTK